MTEKVKTYYGFMSQITADELYKGLVRYGMFSEKLPPIFSGKLFLDYCLKFNNQPFVNKQKQTQRGYVNYCLLYTSPSPRDLSTSRMPSSA